MTPGYTRYAPSGGRSQWHFVAGRTFVAMFDSTASDSVVDALWWLAESDLATIESVVGAFPLVGDDAVRSFAAATIAMQHETGEAHRDGRRARLRVLSTCSRSAAPAVSPRRAPSRGCSPSSGPSSVSCSETTTIRPVRSRPRLAAHCRSARASSTANCSSGRRIPSSAPRSRWRMPARQGPGRSGRRVLERPTKPTSRSSRRRG